MHRNHEVTTAAADGAGCRSGTGQIKEAPRLSTVVTACSPRSLSDARRRAVTAGAQWPLTAEHSTRFTLRG